MEYNYHDAIKSDVLEYIREEINLTDWAGDRDGLEEMLNDTLFVSDSVTGNASGSYTFDTWKAEEYICHNLDLLNEAVEEFGVDINILEKGAEFCDVTIRCYLLGGCIAEALEELEESGELQTEEEEGEE